MSAVRRTIGQLLLALFFPAVFVLFAATNHWLGDRHAIYYVLGILGLPFLPGFLLGAYLTDGPIIRRKRNR